MNSQLFLMKDVNAKCKIGCACSLMGNVKIALCFNVHGVVTS